MENIEAYPKYEFSTFSEEMARKAFRLRPQLKDEDYLTEWLKRSKTQVITEDEQKLINRLHRKLNLFVRSWNEQELKERFISHIIELVDFDLYDLEVTSFSERPMQVIYNKSVVQGKVEWMVANGLFEPEQSFFFIHEYKKEQDSSNDPVGQLLATLFAAQVLNSQTPKPTLFNPSPSSFKDVPLYGIYIIGRMWFFVRLKEDKYYISDAYIATEMEDLQTIVKMLKAQKEMIIELVEKIKSLNKQ